MYPITTYEKDIEWIEDGIIYTTSRMDNIISTHQNIWIGGVDGHGGGYDRKNRYLLKHRQHNTFFYLKIYNDDECETHDEISLSEAKTIYLEWQGLKNYTEGDFKLNIYKSFKETFGKDPEVY